jgi:uncharacterized protein YjaG (DUF416 family)
MDNTEKARELINKHLYLHGGDGLGINDGDVYRAVLDAVSEALTIPDVSSMFSAEQMEQAFNDGVEAEQQRCGEFDIENYC